MRQTARLEPQDERSGSLHRDGGDMGAATENCAAVKRLRARDSGRSVVISIRHVRQWDGPAVLRPRQQAKLARGAKDEENAMSDKLNFGIAVIGIDIGKNSFHVGGAR